MKIILSLALTLFSLTSFAYDPLSPSERVQSDDSEIIELAESITRNISSDLEKSRALYKWVATNISYDQPMKVAIESGQQVPYIQDALTTLRAKIGVCEGYTNLLAAFHRALGIPAKISIGKFTYFSFRSFPVLKKINRIPNVESAPGLHAWNEVKINNKWILSDITSDSGSSSGGAWKRQVQEEFFNVDPEYFNATHFKQGEMEQ
jgi:transglutaminase-like putative cysteine protease